MQTKISKERVLREKQQPNIQMQKVQGPKCSMSSPNLNLRLKSKTVLNKQNHQPNMPIRTTKPTVENSFGAAKLMMRQSSDDLKLQINKQNNKELNHKQFPLFTKQSHPRSNLLTRSINYQTDRNAYAFKKHLKTEQCQDVEQAMPIIEDCQFIKSEYESSEDEANDQKLNYAKSYQNRLGKKNNERNILIHQSLNYEDIKPRQIFTSGPVESKNLRRYQTQREQEKRMKNEIVNDIIMSTKAAIMRSCDFEQAGTLCCFNHKTKKAKYRLNAVLTEQQEECFYCSKCAVNLAKQGFNIEQISNIDRRMIMSRQTDRDYLRASVEMKGQQAKRQEQIMCFQKRIEALKSKISTKLKLFSQKSEQMTKMDKKIDLTISNYDHLIQILKDMKNKQVEKQQKNRKQKTLSINFKRNELSTILDHIKATSFQITNERNTLMTLKNNEFSFMFDAYLNKIASYEDYLKNLEQTQLAIQIATFDENLESEQFDQQKMIHSIFTEMFKKLTNSKLQNLVGSSKHLLKSEKLNKSMIKEAQMESGGSSMFFCEQQNCAEPRPPFRKLFENNQFEDSSAEEKYYMSHSNVNNSMDVNSSGDIPALHRSFKFMKEQNYPSQQIYYKK